MIDILRRIYYFFAPYVNSDERAVGLFFKGLTERAPRATVQRRLGELLQRNIAVVNLWSEHRYKGYRYLTKRQRKELYANLQLIAEDFDAFYTNFELNADEVVTRVRRASPHAKGVQPDRARLLCAMTSYFSPRRGVYEYRVSSSFGRLLRNPNTEKLVGDCNQIVTLYLYIYSCYFDVTELQIRQLPEHVALHYRGVDIEATNGTLTNYNDRDDATLQPIEEIVSINLLDTADSHFKTHEIDPADFLQASRFAYILSHDRSIVTHNLDVAYSMLVHALMKRHDYVKALAFAKQSKNHEFLSIVGHNGAVYYIQQKTYKKARQFAEYAPEKAELVRQSYQSEGAHYFNARRYREALTAYEAIRDTDMIQRCYEGLFFAEQNNLGSNMTVDQLGDHRKILDRMEYYAKKSRNATLVDHVAKLKKHV